MLRDIMDVKFGPYNKCAVMSAAALLSLLGLLAFTYLSAAGAKSAAAFMLSGCFVWAVCLVGYSIVVDHFTEGINVHIEARCGETIILCQTDNQVLQCVHIQGILCTSLCCRPDQRYRSGMLSQFSCPREHVVRLPEAAAFDVVRFLLNHPATAMWREQEMP
jgi:hypothetical protein